MYRCIFCLEIRIESAEVRLSFLESRVNKIEAAVTQLQTAVLQPVGTFGGPSAMSGFGSAMSTPYYNQPYAYNHPPPGFSDWLPFRADQSTSMLESYRQSPVPPLAEPAPPAVTQPVDLQPARQPQVIPVSSSDDKIYLPSTAIDKSQLRDVKVVAEAHKHLQNKEKAPTLCQLLARECFFGKNVMIRCTAGGKGSKGSSAADANTFGLPRDEMNALKRTMVDLLPQYKDCPEEFEPVWDDCVTSLGSACRRFRNKEKARGNV